MLFFSPAMDSVRRSETCARQCQSAIIYRSLPAVIDRFYVSLFAHTMVGVLSQNIPMWQCLRLGMTASKTSHLRILPVSSKSEFVMYPFLFLSDTNWLWTCTGNNIYHTIGVRWCVPLVQTLPALSSDASVNPVYYGSLFTILYTLVGCWEMSFSSASQYSSVSARPEAR